MARSAASRMAPAPIASKRGPYAKSSQTRERILAAAFEVAGDVGLHRVAVAAIADRAGVAVPGYLATEEASIRASLAFVRDGLMNEGDAMSSPCSTGFPIAIIGAGFSGIESLQLGSLTRWQQSLALPGFRCRIRAEGAALPRTRLRDRPMRGPARMAGDAETRNLGNRTFASVARRSPAGPGRRRDRFATKRAKTPKGIS